MTRPYASTASDEKDKSKYRLNKPENTLYIGMFVAFRDNNGGWLAEKAHCKKDAVFRFDMSFSHSFKVAYAPTVVCMGAQPRSIYLPFSSPP